MLHPADPVRRGRAVGRTLMLAMLLVAPAVALAAASEAPVRVDLRVALDPGTRLLTASGRIDLAAGGATRLELSDRFTVETFEVNGEPRPVAGEVANGVRRWWLPSSATPRQVSIRWHGVLEPLRRSQEHADTLGAAEAVADPGGSFLPTGALWYPRIADALASHRVLLELPPGQRGLVPGTLVAEHVTERGWRGEFVFAHPGDGIDLMAGPYTVAERRIAGRDGRTLTLRTWFHPELTDLAEGYLDSAAGYVALYEAWIGDYPFESFDIVSSPTPTGFGMPGLTYLGIEVLRLPFIRYTSLGHEVLHNWWGNGVYVDYTQGNWAEGLTTLMADYHYRSQKGEEAAREARLAWLRDFAAVPAADDRPLAAFTSRRHGASQVIGYHKAAMLFSMLRDRIGAPVFDRGLARLWREYRFAPAGWRQLQRVFETESGEDLADAFAPWLQRPGAPRVEVVSARAIAGGVRVVLRQRGSPWPLRVPLVVETASGQMSEVATLRESQGEFDIALPAPASAVLLDPDFRLFRHLAPGEAPPILRDLMLAPTVSVLALPGVPAALAGELATRMLDGRMRLAASGEDPAVDDPRLVIGLHEAVAGWLAARGLEPRPVELADFAGSALAWAATDDTGRPLVLVSVSDEAALAALLRPLPHYGRQGWVGFEGARAVRRGTFSARSPRVAVTPG